MLVAYFRYPYDEAATVAISTVKEFQYDFKEVISSSLLCYIEFMMRFIEYLIKFKYLFQVHFVLFASDICDIWLNKSDELLKD